jgi:predicted lactoylglutathione lyase
MLERRRFLAIAAGSLLLPRRAAAQATPSAATRATPAGTLGLGIIGLHVADLGASLDFYRRIGLDIPTGVDLSGQAFRLRLPTGQVFFWETVAYTRRDFPDYERGTGQRKVSLEFGFRTPREVDEMYDALVADGYGSYKKPLSWGSIRYAGVVDPDDNQIALRFPLAS